MYLKSVSSVSDGPNVSRFEGQLELDEGETMPNHREYGTLFDPVTRLWANGVQLNSVSDQVVTFTAGSCSYVRDNQSPLIGLIRKVNQTVLGRNGNSLRAAFATYFGIELCRVPDFMTTSDQIIRNYWMDVADFLSDNGYAMQNEQLTADTLDGSYRDRIPTGMWIAVGDTRRGAQEDGRMSHAVVMNGPELYHDPHPEGTGLVRIIRGFTARQLDPFKVSRLNHHVRLM